MTWLLLEIRYTLLVQAMVPFRLPSPCSTSVEAGAARRLCRTLLWQEQTRMRREWLSTCLVESDGSGETTSMSRVATLRVGRRASSLCIFLRTLVRVLLSAAEYSKLF